VGQDSFSERILMKINTIINRYLFKEMLLPFSINLFFFTFIFLMRTILDITNLIVNYKMSVSLVLLMLIYSLPFFFQYVIPMSVMMAVLLTFLRLSSDNEIVALKAGGVSIYRFLPPVFLFCLMGCLLTAFMTIYGMPLGKVSLKKLMIQAAESSIDAGIKEGRFNDNFNGAMLYVNKVDIKNKEMVDIFVEDQRVEGVVSTIIAPRGRVFNEPGGHVFHFNLFDGTINQVDLKNQTNHSINFDIYDVRLDLKQNAAVVNGRQKDDEEMTLGELRHYLQTREEKDDIYFRALTKFHEKFSIPFACLALGLLAVPLGLQSKTDKRSLGIILGLVLFLLYYLMLTIGWSFGQTGIYPPVIGMLLPNVVMGGFGVFLLIRSAKDRPVGFNFLKIRFKR